MPVWSKAISAFAGRIRDEAALQRFRLAEYALQRFLRAMVSKFGRRKKLNIAIKITARFETRREWGDFHFAESLKEAFERRGHRARIDFPEQWYDETPATDDVVLALRGLTAYRPSSGPLNMMWNISHPDQVAYEEYESYDLVFVASLSYATFLATVIDTPVLPLLQATDPRRFHPWKTLGKSNEILFVGNSRGQFRPIIRWALEAGLKPSIYGTRWKGLVPKSLVKGANIDNRSLSQAYARAGIVLNDHWESMRQFGFVSNRIFDVLASGGLLISDAMPTIDRLFGNEVYQVSDAASLAGAVASARRKKLSTGSRRRALAVRSQHSFDQRAARLLGFMRDHQRGQFHDRTTPTLQAPSVLRQKQLRVTILLGGHKPDVTRSEYIRLISPLTSEALAADLQVDTISAPRWPEALKRDVLIVQAPTLRTMPPAFFASIRKSRSRLVLDADGSVPDIERLCADQVWFSNAALKDQFAASGRHAWVVPDSLDPRIWRNFHEPAKSTCERLEMLLLPEHHTKSDAEPLLAALDEQARFQRSERFRLTVIGSSGEYRSRPWLNVLPVPQNCISYPRYARWLRQLGPFHVGLCLWHSDDSGMTALDTARLTYWALGAVPVGQEGRIEAVSDAPPALNGSRYWTDSLSPIITDPASLDDTRTAGAARLWDERGSAQTGILQVKLMKALS